MSLNTIETLETAFCSNEQLVNSLQRIDYNVSLFGLETNQTEIPLLNKLVNSNNPTIVFVIDVSSPIEFRDEVIERIESVIRICGKPIEQVLIIVYNNDKVEIELLGGEEIDNIKNRIQNRFLANHTPISCGCFVNRALSCCVPIENKGGEVFIIHFGYRRGIESLEEANSIKNDLEYERTFERIMILGYDYWLYYIDSCVELKSQLKRRSSGYVTESKCIEMSNGHVVGEMSEDIFRRCNSSKGVVIQIEKEYIDFDTIFGAFGCCEKLDLEESLIETKGEMKKEGNWELWEGTLNHEHDIEIFQFRDTKERITDFYIQRLELETIANRIISEVNGMLKEKRIKVDFGKLFLCSDNQIEHSLSLTEVKAISKGIPKYFVRKKYEDGEIELFGLLQGEQTTQGKYLDSIFSFAVHYSYFRTSGRLILFDFVVSCLSINEFIVTDCHIAHESLRFNQILSNGLKYNEVLSLLKRHQCNDLCRFACLPLI